MKVMREISISIFKEGMSGTLEAKITADKNTLIHNPGNVVGDAVRV